MVCWDDSDERLVDLTREVELWLEGRSDSHPALKKARLALAEYQKLKSRRERDKMTIRNLKEKERTTIAEQDKTQAIEQSLLVQISELEKKLADAEADRNELRTQVAKYKLKNPLPQPPELPVPLNQLAMSTATPRAASSISLYSVPEAGPSSTRRQSQINGSTVQPEHRFLTPYYAPNPYQTQPPDSADRKGKRRARESTGRHSSASVYSNAHSFLSNSHPKGVLSDDEASVILPGAVTQRRVIPPKEATASNTPFPPRDTDEASGGNGSSGLDTSAALNPYSVAALYIGEYMNGYGEGYNTATSGLEPNPQSLQGLTQGEPNGEYTWAGTSQDDTPRLHWSRFSEEIVPQVSEEPRSMYSEHMPPARAPPADQGNDSSEERLVYLNGPRHRTDPASNDVDSNSYREGSSRTAANGTAHSSRMPHRSHRRRTTVPPGHETDVESARRTRDEPRGPPTLRPSSVSVSSWNIHPPAATTAATIATASHTITNHSQNTGSALNLSSFGPASMYPTPPGDTPGSTLSSLGLHSFPLREDDEIVMERLPSATASAGHGSTTTLASNAAQPRQRGERRVSFDHRPAIIGAGGSGSVTSIQSIVTTIHSLGQGQATTATSTVSAIGMTTHVNEPARHTHAHTHNTHTHAHRRSSSGRHTAGHGYARARPSSHHPSTILDGSTAAEDRVHLAAAEMPRPLPRTPPRLRNALGLQLDDNAAGAGGGISAPTPMVSAEGFLRSWSLEQ
ncbi:hypothetical protein AX14_006536 [Amanita brunnescens Koide BX004]|nr:hypothetical protein AX14_006536 [Amanita brunnescens Koide BX004]